MSLACEAEGSARSRRLFSEDCLVHQVLVYSDSLTWGIIPDTRKRLAFDERWPGVLENKLTERGHRLRVIEDCLNGRRTVWDDPFKPAAMDWLVWPNGLRCIPLCHW